MVTGITSRSLSRVGVLLGLCLAAFAQDPSQCVVSTDRVQVAKTFLRNVYPELGENEYTVNVKDHGSFDLPVSLYWFSITLGPYEKDLTITSRVARPTKRPSNSQILPFSAGFEFDHESVLRGFGATSELLNTSANKELVAIVDAHPDWTDAEIIATMKKVGARYTPENKDEFVRSLPLAQMRPLLGDFRFLRANFNFRNEAALKRGFPAANLWWTVYLQATQGKNQRYYGLTFEPIGGRLRTIDEIDQLPPG